LGFRAHPLANVRLSIGAFPYTVAMLDAFHPLSVVDFSVLPLVDTFAIDLSVLVGALERVSISEHFEAPTMPFVLQPLSLIDPAILVNKDAHALSLPAVIELTSVDAVFVLFYSEISPLAHFFKVKFIADHLIALDRVTFVLELTFVFARGSESLL